MTKRWIPYLWSLALAALALALPKDALAVGTVKWKATTLKEESGSWKIDVEVHLPKPPDMAHVPVRFSFQPTVYYERTLVDGVEGPQLRKVPLENRQPIVESVDLGFMDAGRGEIQKRTRFSFKITRAHGFEAGEYTATIKDGRSGGQIGSSARLILDGENEIIDRRSMVFTGNDKKKKKDEEEKDEGGGEEASEEPEPKQELTPDDDAYWAGGPKEGEPSGPPPIEEKPGGCGCRVAAGPGDAIAPLGLGLVLLGAASARRRRPSRPSAASPR
jgi:MYXO-CTERM domain-containing protein